MTDLDVLAERLDEAARQAIATPQLDRALTLDDAYAIQARSLSRRYARGERRAGVKMGFTSRAKMAQMGITEMIFGRLTDAMLIENGGVVAHSTYVHPRAEPEIAFRLGRPLSGRVDLMTAMAAVDGVASAIELIDSRYKDFKFSLTDVVADNSSSSGFVVGSWRRPDVDLDNLGMVFELDGVARQIGSSAAILGHPANSLVAAARLVAERGERLEPGDIVMAGGATAAEALSPGQHVGLTVQNLGSVSFSLTP